MIRRLFVFSLIALVPALVQQKVQGQEIPKAETVLADFIQATGGKAVYEKFKSRTRSGTIEIEGTPLMGKVQVFQAAPRQFAMVTEIGPGKTIQATDGKSAWVVSPLGTRLLKGADQEDSLREATFNSELLTKELFQKVECTGIENVEGKPAYKVVLTAKTGKVKARFYDKKSHLLVKEAETIKSPRGEVEVETLMSDYKPVDGVLLPSTITQKIPGAQIVMKITETKHDVDIPAATFKRPASLDGAEEK